MESRETIFLDVEIVFCILQQYGNTVPDPTIRKATHRFRRRSIVGERERGREGERGRVALFRKKLFQSPITKRGNGAEWERERRENERMNDMTADRYSSGICRFSSI